MFDPYHRWLAIPRGERPPTYYQLLSIDNAETDPEVIKEAALRQTTHVRSYQTGPHSEICTALLNEIAEACTTLTHAERRREYDAHLRRHRHGAAASNRADSPARPASVAPTTSERRPFRRSRSAHDSVDAEIPPTPQTSSLIDPFALAYVALLVLGGLVAFWLGHVQ